MSLVEVDADLVTVLSDHARRFASSLAAGSDVERVQVPDFLIRARCEGTLSKPVVWTNDVFTGPDFRWAHVEFFSIPDQIGVIHVCVFPRMDRPAPIFGFDIIAGRRKATGAFLDLSPTTPVRRTDHRRLGRQDRGGPNRLRRAPRPAGLGPRHLLTPCARHPPRIR